MDGHHHVVRGGRQDKRHAVKDSQCHCGSRERLLQNMYEDSETLVRCAVGVTDGFQVSSGWRLDYITVQL